MQVLQVRLTVDIVASGLGDDAQLGLRPAKSASTSSRTARGARSRHAASMRVCHRSVGSNT
jgi:hypothetical protein